MHLLFLFVLLLHIHSISSASLLSMKKLTAEEVPVYTAVANMTNLATLVGPSLAGYYTEVYYSDAACSAVLYSEQFQLQVCTPWITGASFIATFNGTHTLTNTYRDVYNISPQLSYLCSNSSFWQRLNSVRDDFLSNDNVVHTSFVRCVSEKIHTDKSCLPFPDRFALYPLD